jgi:exonuclease VII large subunit
MLYAEPDREHETGQTKPECKDRCEQWNRVGKTGRQKWTPKNRRLKSEAETSEKKTGLSPAHKSCSRPRKNQNQIGWKTNAQATWWQQKNTRLKAMLAQIWENQRRRKRTAQDEIQTLNFQSKINRDYNSESKRSPYCLPHLIIENTSLVHVILSLTLRNAKWNWRSDKEPYLLRSYL